MSAQHNTPKFKVRQSPKVPDPDSIYATFQAYTRRSFRRPFEDGPFGSSKTSFTRDLISVAPRYVQKKEGRINIADGLAYRRGAGRACRRQWG